MHATRAVVATFLAVGATALALHVPGSRAQAPTPVLVTVFEGRGLGHGVGLPLDGAAAAAREGGSADEILERFFPGTEPATGRGTVRVSIAEMEAGGPMLLAFPDGGEVRDGRTGSRAPSFPVTLRPGDRARLTWDGEFYRAEAVPGPGPDGDGALPLLAASPHGLWIEPAGEGVARVDGDGRPLAGLSEGVGDGPTLHLVKVVDVEDYVRGLDLGDELLLDTPPAAVEALVIAARSYALRSARAPARPGIFDLYGDERGHTFGGAVPGPPEWREAVAATRGQIRVVRGTDVLPAATLTCPSAAGVTAAASEVYGPASAGEAYLGHVRYDAGEPPRWRADVALDEVAGLLGFDGVATDLAVTARSESGRPARLHISGPDGSLEVEAERFHPALRLPSTWFDVRVEQRAQAPGPRTLTPLLQRLPGPPGQDEREEPESQAGGPWRVPLVAALAGIGAVAVAAVAFLAARAGR